MSAYQGGDGRRELQLGKNRIRTGPHEMAEGGGAAALEETGRL